MAWGLSKFGFNRPNQAEIKIEMDKKAKELFGDDINLAPKSFLGQLIGVFSWFLAKGYETAESVYKSGHVTEAEGVQLDYHTPYFSTSRGLQQNAEVILSLTGTPFFRVLSGTRFETELEIDFSLKTDIIFDANGNATGEAVSVQPGTVGNVPANSITIQSEPTGGITSVTNPLKAKGGQDKETDAQLLDRLLRSPSSYGSATINAILSAVLGVKGVRSAFVKENNTINVVDGQAPKSFQVFAFGGEGADIAKAIFEEGAGGIEPFGTTQYAVKDNSGNEHLVAFTPASAVSVYVTAELTVDNTFEADGIQQVRKEIISLIAGNPAEDAENLGLTMGEDVIRFQIERAIGKIQGVKDAVVNLGRTQSEQTPNNIVIAPNEIAIVNNENINVTVSP